MKYKLVFREDVLHTVYTIAPHAHVKRSSLGFHYVILDEEDALALKLTLNKYDIYLFSQQTGNISLYEI